MLFEVLPDPRVFTPRADGAPQTLQIHRAIPAQVPVGRFEDRGGRVEEIVDETVGRAEYLDRVQRACGECGGALEVRFYDHFDQELDASVLDQLSEIRNLTISVPSITDPGAVGRLPKLSILHFTPPWNLKNPKILAAFGVHRLTHFTLTGVTPMPTIDLAPLGDARGLRSLRLLGVGKSTESIGACASLTELALHPSPRFSLDFVNRLHRLEVLKLVLGRVSSIRDVHGLPVLRDLSLFEVHLLEELGDLQRFPGLRRLQLSDQKRIAEIRVGAANVQLEHMRLYSVPALHSIIGLSSLPALKTVWAYDSRLDLSWSELPATLTHFQLVTKGTKGREAHDAEVRAHGLIPGLPADAEFFYK
jgi:hypothetical protein